MPLLALLVKCVETVPLNSAFKGLFYIEYTVKTTSTRFFIVKLSTEALTLHQSPSLVHLLL